jgi:hypothetical protein
MLIDGLMVRTGRMPVLVLVIVAAMLSGCTSRQERALDQAKKQAAATGPKGFRAASAAGGAGECEHPGRHHADHPD